MTYYHLNKEQMVIPGVGVAKFASWVIEIMEPVEKSNSEPVREHQIEIDGSS